MVSSIEIVHDTSTKSVLYVPSAGINFLADIFKSIAILLEK